MLAWPLGPANAVFYHLPRLDQAGFN